MRDVCTTYCLRANCRWVKRDRKLCFVVQNSLARGPAARPRCIPPASGSSWALNPIQSHRSYRRSTTRGRLRSPCTHRSFQEDHGAIAPLGTTRRAWRRASPPAPNHAQTFGRPITNQGSVPAPTDTPMRTSSRPLHGDQPRAVWMRAMSWRRASPETRKGAFHSCPCLGTIPSTKARSCPTGPLTSRPPVGCRQRIGAEPDHGKCRRPLNPGVAIPAGLPRNVPLL